MAACASCLISLSSSCRGTEGWFLVLGIVSPTTTTSSAALATGSTYSHKIMSDDAPTHVSFKSDLTLIKGSLHAETVFARAHACFNACSPALATPKPALFLSRCPVGTQTAARRQNHLFYSQLGGSLFVGAVPEASVSSSQSGCLTEKLHMGLQCRCPLLLIAEVARGHGIIADQAVLDFVNPDQASKFIGLVSFALANDDAVGFKQAQDLVRMPRLCLENARLSLGDDLLNQGQVVFERTFCCDDLQESFATGHQLAIVESFQRR